MPTKIIFALVLMLMAGTAMASSCPNHIAQINQLLDSKELSSDVQEQVKSLRDEGEAAHDDNDHDTAMAKLGEALELLADDAHGASY